MGASTRARRRPDRATVARDSARAEHRSCDHSERGLYHHEHNHQGVGNRLLMPAEQAVRPVNRNAPIERRERLGGLLNFYYRRAA